METPVTTTRPAQLVNVSEAAQFLSVSPSTLYGWVWQFRRCMSKGKNRRRDVAYAAAHIRFASHPTR